MVRAKVRCNAITQRDGQRDVLLEPVYGTGQENATWSKYTPSGSISLTITNPDAYNQFEVGKEYYVDFTPADPAASAQ